MNYYMEHTLEDEILNMQKKGYRFINCCEVSSLNRLFLFFEEMQDPHKQMRELLIVDREEPTTTTAATNTTIAASTSAGMVESNNSNSNNKKRREDSTGNSSNILSRSDLQG